MDEIVPHSSWKDGNFSAGPAQGLPPAPPPPGASITVDDILYALFRHKGLIVFCSLVGLGIAAAIFKLTPRLYFSEATILVKSIPQNESLGPTAGGASVRELPMNDVTVSSEIGVLLSIDLAERVAEIIGPEKILAKAGGGDDLEAAKMTIRGGLHAFVQPRTFNISVIFQHPDRTLVQPVLSNIIHQYFQSHYQIHRALPNADEFENEKAELKTTVATLEARLLALRETNSIFSIEDEKKAAAAEVETTTKALRNVRQQIAEVQAILQRFQKDGQEQHSTLDDPEFLQRQKEYADLFLDLERQRNKEQSQMALGYPRGSRMVQSYTEAIAELEAKKKKLEAEFPELLGLSVNSTNVVDPLLEKRRAEFLQITAQSLSNRLSEARSQQARVFAVADLMAELETLLKHERGNLDYFSEKLSRAKFDARLQSARDSNISLIQRPAPPVLQLGSLYKKMGMAAVGGIGVGLVLALLLELFLDQRVKRPEDARRLLPVPLYLSIPRGARKDRRRLTDGAGPVALLKDGDTTVPAKSVSNGTSDPLQPYFDALRDRVLSRFDHLARKPKLVGVSGCAGGSAGGTRIAAGLAGALSEAGDLKILLVDMKSWNGKPHPILGRRKSCTLQEALEHQNQQEAQVAPNLYLASAENGDSQQLARSTPKFTRSIPQMAASDYDYIIFDMPEVDQISITPRLAKHMDLMLLVVEAEKAHRAAVKQAGALLLESTPNVAMVLNNMKATLPKSLRSAV